MRLLDVKRSGKEIHILYFGDFDPSGDAMDDHLKIKCTYPKDVVISRIKNRRYDYTLNTKNINNPILKT
jgi:hypothetical protein